MLVQTGKSFFGVLGKCFSPVSQLKLSTATEQMDVMRNGMGLVFTDTSTTQPVKGRSRRNTLNTQGAAASEVTQGCRLEHRPQMFYSYSHEQETCLEIAFGRLSRNLAQALPEMLTYWSKVKLRNVSF